MSNEAMREAFETYMSGDGRFPKAVERDGSGGYLLGTARAGWADWQAAWRAACEHCATLCETSPTLSYSEGVAAMAVIAGTDHISNLTAALHTEQDRTHRYLARAEQAEAALAAEKRKAEDAREVIGKMLRFIDERASVSGYGFYRPANPHDFSPDHDSCSADELAAHKAACEAYDRGEYTAPKGSEFLRDDDGKVTLHILRAPWGIGSYSETDPDAVPLIDAARAFLAKGDGA